MQFYSNRFSDLGDDNDSDYDGVGIKRTDLGSAVSGSREKSAPKSQKHDGSYEPDFDYPAEGNIFIRQNI